MEQPAPPVADQEQPPREPIDLADALSKAKPADWVCLGGIVASVVLGLVSYPLAAFLLAHIKLHLVLTASLSALLTAGASLFYGTDHLWVVVPLAVVGLAKFDPFFFWAGRRYGDHVAHFLEDYGSIRPRTVARVERWTARWGAPMLTLSYFVPFIPARLVMVLLGASGVSWVVFWVADLLGTVAWIATYLAIGHHFHTEVHHIATVVNHYSKIVGFSLLAVVIVLAVVRGSRSPAARVPRSR